MQTPSTARKTQGESVGEMHPQNRPNPTSRELLVLPLPAHPHWKLGVDLSRQFPLQLNSQHRTQSRADRQHVGCASQGHTGREDQLQAHRDTHTPHSARFLGMFPHPQTAIPTASIILGTHLPSPLPSEQPRRDFLLILQVPSWTLQFKLLFYLPTPKGSPPPAQAAHTKL